VQVDELKEKWIQKHNKHYSLYYSNEVEPRYDVKQFFLQSYLLMKRFSNDQKWIEYLEDYRKIFKRDPGKDWYSHRDPTDRIYAWRNSVEWVNIFEIISEVGFPYKQKSVKENMIKYLPEYLQDALMTPDKDCHDFMLMGAIKVFNKTFEVLRGDFISWLNKEIKVKEFTPHQLMAYMVFLENDEKQKELHDLIEQKLITWIKNPIESVDKQVLIWARLITRFESWKEYPNLYNLMKKNFNECLENIYIVNLPNQTILLEAAFMTLSEKEKEIFQHTIEEAITPAKLYRLREIFPFLDDNDDLPEIQKEIEKIHEKCDHPTKEMCKECITEKKYDCWLRIINKVNQTRPWPHGGFEVADSVLYDETKGIYIVIKSIEISKMAGEGEKLYRQCTQHFTKSHALVLYWNAFDTHPSVIDSIRGIAQSSINEPRFVPVQKKYIRQVYKKYLEIGT